ncbi:MAG: hypothetical protein FJ109_06015 [Deltaproteobacteria bacterium]|nr:hypothetical protein [Deltaproteobacteria bacterium]
MTFRGERTTDSMKLLRVRVAAFCFVLVSGGAAGSCGNGTGSGGADAGSDGPGGDAAHGDFQPDLPLPTGDLREAGADGAGDLDAAPQFAPLECPDVSGTAKNLLDKAEYFDLVARKWHLPAGQDHWFSVRLKEDLETFDQVDMSDNVGSWTAMYSASQSFRYATTKDPEALENLRRVVRGEHNMMKITGVPGLFSRVMINPSLPGFPSAEKLAVWYPDCDLSVKHCKRFNEVTEGEFKGWWFKNDVSKDEYAAHMFAMAVAWEVVDDPEVRTRVEDIVLQVGDHLVDHKLAITDIDGKMTLFGGMMAMGVDDFPPFDAVLSLSWLKLAAVVGGPEKGKKYQDFLDDCLLQKNGVKECIPPEPPKPYTDYLDMVGLDLGCKTNWNNHNMSQLAMYSLIRTEDDPVLKALYRKTLRKQMWEADDHPMAEQQKTLYAMFYMINKDPKDPWPEQAAREALCTMKRFREHKAHFAVDNISKYKTVCTARDDDPMTDFVLPIEEQAMDNYLWGGNPYELEVDPGDPQLVESPEDYLLAYWMGRYFGFIAAEM